jgi:hypothetical protein
MKIKFRDIHAANVTRALKTQKRRKAEGCCIICGAKAVDAWYCQPHKTERAIWARNAYRRKHGIPLNAPLYSTYKRHNESSSLTT